jgi:hypothetical protein
MPAARFIRLAARTAAPGSIAGARVGRRVGEGPTAGRKVSVRTAKPKSVATGVTMAVALRVIVCPYVERELAGVFSRRLSTKDTCHINRSDFEMIAGG